MEPADATVHSSPSASTFAEIRDAIARARELASTPMPESQRPAVRASGGRTLPLTVHTIPVFEQFDFLEQLGYRFADVVHDSTATDWWWVDDANGTFLSVGDGSCWVVMFGRVEQGLAPMQWRGPRAHARDLVEPSVAAQLEPIHQGATTRPHRELLPVCAAWARAGIDRVREPDGLQHLDDVLDGRVAPPDQARVAAGSIGFDWLLPHHLSVSRRMVLEGRTLGLTLLAAAAAGLVELTARSEEDMLVRLATDAPRVATPPWARTGAMVELLDALIGSEVEVRVGARRGDCFRAHRHADAAARADLRKRGFGPRGGARALAAVGIVALLAAVFAPLIAWNVGAGAIAVIAALVAPILLLFACLALARRVHPLHFEDDAHARLARAEAMLRGEQTPELTDLLVWQFHAQIGSAEAEAGARALAPLCQLASATDVQHVLAATQRSLTFNASGAATNAALAGS